MCSIRINCGGRHGKRWLGEMGYHRALRGCAASYAEKPHGADGPPLAGVPTNRGRPRRRGEFRRHLATI
jgi:hypothetical protein